MVLEELAGSLIVNISLIRHSVRKVADNVMVLLCSKGLSAYPRIFHCMSLRIPWE